MKKAFLRFLSILMIGFMFFSCANSTGGDSDDSNTQKQQQQNNSGKTNSGKTNSGTTNNGTTDSGTTDSGTTDSGTTDSGTTDSGTTDSGTTDSGTTDSGTTDDSDEQIDDTPAANRKIGVTFDFTGAQALAKLEAKQDGSRAVTNVDELGDLVKILADGSMENAITVDENCSLSDIVAIYKSPLETSNDVFIVFNSESTIGYEEVEKEYDWGEKYIDKQEIRVGQLICLHEDGSIADILRKENSTGQGYSHVYLKAESVTFDTAGNIYFISNDNGDMIYQYNPATDELTKMVAAVENTYYEKMQIDDEGQWIFVSGSRNNSYFLRAIPINNPNGFVNVFYSSNWGCFYSEGWIYDNKNGKLYFIASEGSNTGLFIATKAGGFKDKSFYHRDIGDSFDNVIFEAFNDYSNYSWEGCALTNGQFDSSKIIDTIISHTNSFWDSKTNRYVTISKEDIDIRFDKYFASTDKLKALAVLTAGKKNEEAIEALNNSVGMATLYYYWEGGLDTDGKNWFDSVSGEGYRHNFLADIIYLRDTDTLLVDVDEVNLDCYDYAYDENENQIYVKKIIKGSELFWQKDNGLYEWNGNGIYFVNMTTSSTGSAKTYAFADQFYNSDGTLNSEALLDYFFSFCNVEGSKEFRLSSLKNDEQYGLLYSDLTNEKAIEWINSDAERLNLFGHLSGIYFDWDNSKQKSVIQASYAPFMNLLSKTCYIAGTNQKAITWNWNCGRIKKNESVPYMLSWQGIKFSATDTGVYYEYYSESGDFGLNPFYYIVQVADSDGKLVELVNKLPLPSGKVVKSEKNNDRILLQYSVMDENGAELGYHHIYSVEMANGKVTNCFDNVPNRNNLEVVSFNSAGDLLYYSAVRGTSVENGIVNIVTNEYNPLTVQRKMVAVYTFN